MRLWFRPPRESSPSNTERDALRRNIKKFLSYPVTYLALTRGCSNHCPFCCEGSTKSAGPSTYMPVGMIEELVTVIKEEEASTGATVRECASSEGASRKRESFGLWFDGDPLDHPDIVRIVRILAESADWNITTAIPKGKEEVFLELVGMSTSTDYPVRLSLTAWNERRLRNSIVSGFLDKFEIKKMERRAVYVPMNGREIEDALRSHKGDLTGIAMAKLPKDTIGVGTGIRPLSAIYAYNLRDSRVPNPGLVPVFGTDYCAQIFEVEGDLPNGQLIDNVIDFSRQVASKRINPGQPFGLEIWKKWYMSERVAHSFIYVETRDWNLEVGLPNSPPALKTPFAFVMPGRISGVVMDGTGRVFTFADRIEIAPPIYPG